MGLSHTELAQRLGTSQSSISAIEQGTRRVYADELVEICQAFGTDLSTLLHRADQSDRDILGI